MEGGRELTILENYEFIRKIGIGSYSEVYLCIHKVLNCNRVIKKISKKKQRLQRVYMRESFRIEYDMR